MIHFFTNAQFAGKKDVELSILIGLTSSNYYGNPYIKDNQYLIKPTFGINADFYQNESWSVRIGLEYKTMGTQIKQFEYNSNSFLKIREKLNYIYIPAHANWHFGKNKNWNLNFGPSLSFLQSAYVNDYEVHKEGYANLQFGIGFGIGYKFKISEDFNLAIEHQEYIAVTNTIYKKSPFYGNYLGQLDVRLIYTF